MSATRLPTGTVSFLFTDIEGSTHLLQQTGERWPVLLETHFRLLREACEAHGGAVVRTFGDAMFIAFDEAHDALAGALASQLALASHPWPEANEVRVRMGVHTGDALATHGDYVGLAVHQAARICSAAHGRQVVVSDATLAAAGALPQGAATRDLGLHRLKDLPEPERLYQLTHPALADRFPRLRSDALPGNLPKQITSFIGRRQETITAAKLLQDGCRLLTFTGPGGCGKTRLALEVAVDVVDNFSNGAWVVELAPLSEASMVAPAVASALDLREEPGADPNEGLAVLLKDKHLLLILDSCEHLVDTCARLVDTILRMCPGVQIVATTQEALGLVGETVQRVPSLSLPAEGEPDRASALAHYEGVQLFVDRARDRRPGFELRDENAGAVAHICRRLDGIPLAIELAAARVNVLSPQQIASRLDDQFLLLTGGSRTALPRQQTLRAALDWSHDLLGPDEQLLLRRLAVFAGGWTLEAAEAVCSGNGLEPNHVLDLLDRLVARSLVFVEEQDNAARYRLLEIVRQYSQAKLVEAGEVVECRTYHLRWFRSLVQVAEDELTGPDQAAWLGRLAADYGNVRAAMEWAASQDDAGAADLLLLATLMWRFWLVRGHWTEGRAWLDRALVADTAADPALRARALAAAGDLATEQHDLTAAEPLLQRSLELSRRLGDDEGFARALNHLGNLASARLEHDAARSMLGEALALRRASGDERGTAVSLRNLGNLAAMQRDFETARTLFEEALGIARRLGDKRVIAALTNAQAAISFADYDRAAARHLADEGLVLSRQLGDKKLIAEHLTVLAGISAAEGESEAAERMLDEAAAIWKTLGTRDSEAQPITILGDMALTAGDWTSARALLRQAETGWRRLGDVAALAWVLNLCGLAACMEGDLEEAQRLLEESVELGRNLDDDTQLAMTLYTLGDVARFRGDLAEARRLYYQSLELARETGWRNRLWWPSQGLAVVSRLEGDYDHASLRLRESIALRPRIGRSIFTADCLEETACVVGAQQRWPEAVELLAAADQLRDESGVPVAPVRRPDLDRCLDAARAAMGDDLFDKAWSQGQSADPDEALSTALDAD